MRNLVVILTLTLIAAPSIAQKVFVDFDSSADFDSYKTFAWATTPETSMQSSNALMHSRLKNGIEHYLTQGGLTEVESDPDLYVTYHTSDKEELSINTTNWGYGYGPRWGWDPYWGGSMGTTTSSVTSYTRGTLVIDIWDAKEKQMIWRGSASDVIPQNPDKLAKKIDKSLAKIVKEWQKKYSKM